MILAPDGNTDTGNTKPHNRIMGISIQFIYSSVFLDKVRIQATMDEITIKEMIAANKAIRKYTGLTNCKGILKRILAVISDITIVSSDITVFPIIFPRIIAGKVAGAAKISASVPLNLSLLISPADEKQIHPQSPISPAPNTTYAI
jgi:hypothetical protein